MKRSGILFLISAPSGGGKSTLLKMLSDEPDFVYSISCTTRTPRPGEVDGCDYHFLSVAEFERRIAARVPAPWPGSARNSEAGGRSG